MYKVGDILFNKKLNICGEVMSTLCGGIITQDGEVWKNHNVKKCCEITKEEQELLQNGDFSIYELFGTDGVKTCPKCHALKMKKRFY